MGETIMKMDYNLKLEQTQKLIITPELKLAIALLQHSALELQDHIQEELLNNPALEIQENEEDEKAGLPEEDKEPEDVLPKDDFPWEEYFRDMDIESGFEMKSGTYRKQDELGPAIENCAEIGGTMLEDLLGQLRMLPLTPRQYSMAAFLAGNLDHNGYLKEDIEELSAGLGAKIEELEEALRQVQKLEPAGIGCRSLQECLMIQLKRYDDVPDKALEIVYNFLPAAADERFQYIASRLECCERVVQEAVEFIRTLNPKPGSVFGEGQETRYIIPDVIVEKVDDNYVVMNNDSTVPQLTISPFYQKMLRNSATDEFLTEYIKGKIEKACWLIRSIEQRRMTLFKVAQQIVEIQRPFLDYGIKKLKPLTLKDVAVNISVHESTVSRAAANKYIQTPRGLFPFKFFFSSGLAGLEGTDFSSHSIKSFISELIKTESPVKPLSDQKLVKLLERKGINISRRTVAKYREELSIPASYKRRRK